MPRKARRVNPSPETLNYYGKVEVRQSEVSKELAELRERSATTRDGEHIVLSANIELPDDVTSVSAHGAEGIGGKCDRRMVGRLRFLRVIPQGSRREGGYQ